VSARTQRSLPRARAAAAAALRALTAALRALTAIPCVHACRRAGFGLNTMRFSTRCPRTACGLELIPPDGHNNERDNVWPLLFTPGKPILCSNCALASPCQSCSGAGLQRTGCTECLLPPVLAATWSIPCPRCNCRLQVDRDAASGAELITAEPVNPNTIVKAQIDSDYYLLSGQEVPDIPEPDPTLSIEGQPQPPMPPPPSSPPPASEAAGTGVRSRREMINENWTLLDKIVPQYNAYNTGQPGATLQGTEEAVAKLRENLAIGIAADIGEPEDFVRRNFDEVSYAFAGHKQKPNSRCVCGSGKKYKKCCWLKQIELDNAAA
jgi:hypothetical protein